MEPTPPGQGSAPEPLVVRLPHASVDDFIQRYAAGLTAGGIYVRCDASKPVGTLVQLEVLLRSGERVLFGLGMVSFRTTGESAGLAGMGIKFLGLDQASTALVTRACSGRAGADAPLPPLPTASAAVEGEGAPPPATIFAFHASSTSPTAPPALAAPRGASAAPVESPLDRVKPLRGKPQGPIIGIDLGTTYSCVACVKGGKPYVIPSREGHNTLPSVIALSSRNRMLVGHPAKGQMLTNPRQTVYGAKRLIGRPFNSDVVQQVRERFQYEIVEGERGEAAVRLGGKVWSLQQISAMVLLETREVAEHHLGAEVRRAVITVPAYYNDAQRQAVREAGALAGLHVERIINEPTAAALAFGSGRQLQKTVLIYDLGGGTFDASLLQMSGNVYEVVSTGGDTFLGGVDFDAAIVDHLIAEFEQKTGHPFAGDAVAHQRLMDAAERAKCELSEQNEARIRVPFVTVVDGKPHDIDTTLTRNRLEELAAPLVVRTISVCREVLQARGIEPRAVEEVIVVGGMSRMPLVHAAIEEFFGKAPHKGVHPDEAVALGASLFAHSLGQQEGVVLIDVLPVSIGIGLPGGRLKKIIERNTALPHSKTYEVATTRDNQEELELCVFQGDGDRIDGAELLGTVRLAPLPRKPRGEVKIAVEFALSAECLLTITAREKSQGIEVKAALSTRDTPASVRSRLGVEASPSGHHPSWGAGGGRLPQRSTKATTAERRPQSWWDRFLSLFRRTKPGPGGGGPNLPPAVGT